MTVEEIKYGNGWLCLKTFNPDNELLEYFKPGEYEIRLQKLRRTKRANDYMWALCRDISKKVGIPVDDVYRNAIREMPVYKDFHDMTEDAAQTLKMSWAMLGKGWFTEQVDFEPDGEHVVIRAYYGSSQYNPRQMSRLIDNLLEDARALGIKTPDEDYINGLIKEYEKDYERSTR